MHRRDFLKLLSTAVALPLVPRLLGGVTCEAAEIASLRPTYRAWLDTKLPTLIFTAMREQPTERPTIQAFDPGEEVPIFELCLHKVDLSSSRRERLATLLALQEKYPWPMADWRAAVDEARNARDDARMQPLFEVYQSARGMLPDVWHPDRLTETTRKALVQGPAVRTETPNLYAAQPAPPAAP